MKSLMKRSLAMALAGGFLCATGQAFAQETLNVFWVKGFYKSEDDALFEAVAQFEQRPASRSRCRNTRSRT